MGAKILEEKAKEERELATAIDVALTNHLAGALTVRDKRVLKMLLVGIAKAYAEGWRTAALSYQREAFNLSAQRLIDQRSQGYAEGQRSVTMADGSTWVCCPQCLWGTRVALPQADPAVESPVDDATDRPRAPSFDVLSSLTGTPGAGAQEGIEIARVLRRRIGDVISVLERLYRPTEDHKAQLRTLREWEAMTIRIGWPVSAAPSSSSIPAEPNK